MSLHLSVLVYEIYETDQNSDYSVTNEVNVVFLSFW